MTTNTPRNDPNATTMKDGETRTKSADHNKPREDKDGNTGGKTGGGTGYDRTHDRDAATRDASRESNTRRTNDGSKEHSGSRHVACDADGAATDMNDDAKDDEGADRSDDANTAKKGDRSKDTDRSKRGRHNP